MSKTQENELETAFQLIDKGNTLEESGDWWSAADSFAEAMHKLESLSREASKQYAGENEAADSSAVQEQIKISQLYGRQSYEYRIRARSCLIKALTVEHDKDQNQKDTIDTTEPSEARKEPLCMSISEEEAQQRCRIFSSLFTGGECEKLGEQAKDLEEPATEVEDVAQKQDSLEERLKELNSSLPSGFKTSSERVSEINKGLRRLGLSLYSHQDERPSLEVERSEEEQIQEIMSQARDEVQFGVNKESREERQASKGLITDIDVDFTESEDSSDSELLDDGAARQRKAIRRRVVRGQVKLAEIVALLDAKAHDDDSVTTVNSDESKSEVGIDLDEGKEKLIEARKCLSKALREWKTEE